MKVIDIIQDIINFRELPDNIHYEIIHGESYRVLNNNSNNMLFMFSMCSEQPMVVFSSFSYINFVRDSSTNLVISCAEKIPTVFDIDEDLTSRLFQYYLVNDMTGKQMAGLERLIEIYKSFNSASFNEVQVIFDTDTLISLGLE